MTRSWVGVRRLWCLVVLLLSVGVFPAGFVSTEAAARALTLDEDSPEWLREAERLGITRAVQASRLPRRTQRRIAAAIVREARRQKVDPLLIVAVIRTESSFNAYAVSSVGARGLMQVMPGTGEWLLSKRGEKLYRDAHLFDPELNIELGTWYLAQLIERFGSVEKALVAYNAGPTTARRILSGPDQGKRFRAGYPRKVLDEYEGLRRKDSALARNMPAERQPSSLSHNSSSN